MNLEWMNWYDYDYKLVTGPDITTLATGEALLVVIEQLSTDMVDVLGSSMWPDKSFDATFWVRDATSWSNLEKKGRKPNN